MNLTSKEYYDLLLMRLKYIRSHLDYTQPQIANRLGVSLRHYQRIESGGTQLTVQELLKLSEILGVKVRDLLTDAPMQKCETFALMPFDDMMNIPLIKDSGSSGLFASQLLKNYAAEDHDHEILAWKDFMDAELCLFFSNPYSSYMNRKLQELGGRLSNKKATATGVINKLNYLLMWETIVFDEPGCFTYDIEMNTPLGKLSVTSYNFVIPKVHGSAPYVLGAMEPKLETTVQAH
ncbi:helix-turn-helix domain-containing protein [Pseudobacteriovorax antillogorgiicola]|uniref:Helix-turn-helix n=1 Tax=Pseudobacteriovorax antillogorgiicola TaxID=1513793 RepID=A0A1Y6CF93_9BACT|nr:helix-turn-helix transcriptional regulator [Pseudobacteriovorax antillogorgiicola]TCS49049.1 helix-turn-helix protein [Pseudobacteriovorax antillogorgiicola]SMF52549.1 Helix-turn-helix [Pseudobacteriovorax antillogorgiicola]